MSYPPPPGEHFPPAVDPYETPQHTQPLFEQPNFEQPHFAQPTFVQPTGYAPHFPPAPPKSRKIPIVLLSVAIGLVLLVGSTTVFYLAGKKLIGGGTTSAGPSSGASADPGPGQVDITISEPKTLNGHAKIEAEELASLTTDLEKELEGYPGAANAFGAVYGDLADKKMIAALAAEVDVDDPQLMLDTVFQSFSGESQLTSVSPASTGSLGGVAQCGGTTVAKEDVAICGWVDEGSVGMILYFYETAVDVKGDFPDMRAEIETKN
ncbi:hypothetical protein ACTI_52180 [Actinoplanes sp. OR16]|uniref:hypothetical protein n=1 Tax=Actinoplanes sp. OR16 TaxID=946334 RepID=UPI000F6FE54A|nr:hypothetical protein [Actinoplanes sp. OR16]BBH68533.1 hypothetical protein ACTI_52180 [Actinoplanes sp. OR16]